VFSAWAMKFDCWSEFTFMEVDNCVDAFWNYNYEFCKVELAFSCHVWLALLNTHLNNELSELANSSVDWWNALSIVAPVLAAADTRIHFISKECMHARSNSNVPSEESIAVLLPFMTVMIKVSLHTSYILATPKHAIAEKAMDWGF